MIISFAFYPRSTENERPARASQEEIVMSNIIDAIEKEQLKSDITNFNVGDGVRVHTRVVEGDKERIQVFAGIVIGRKGPWIKRDVHRPAHLLRRGCGASDFPFTPRGLQR
jgi:hypothetical protein